MSSLRRPLSLRPPLVTAALGLSAFLVAPALAADTGEMEATSSAPIVVVGKRPEANPYADPQAPYKVDRSASGKITTPLQDTARSISVIPKEVIDDLGANSVRDLVRTQPGITLGTGEGGNAFGDRIFIRGFEARNDVYIDGQRDPGVVSREIFAVEQVEIIKGPNSTLGGRGTTGGAVSLISKAPAATGFVQAELTGGTDNTKRLTLDVNQPLTDTLSVRVNTLYHDSNVAGRDEVYSDRWGVAAALAYAPMDSLRFALDYYHLTADSLPDWGVPFDVRSQQPFDVDRGNFYGLLARDFAENRADIATFKVVADMTENLSFHSQTRMGRTRNSYITSAPEAPVITNPDPALWTARANPKNRNAVADYLAHMSDVTAKFDTLGVGHTLVAGVELAQETVENRPYAFAQSETVGAPIVPAIVILQPLFNPDSGQAWPLARVRSGASTKATVDSHAFYLLDTLELPYDLTLTSGLRYDDYRVKNRAVTAAGVVTSLRHESDFLNWNLGLTWKPLPSLTLYTAASTSSNPSGEQLDGNGVSYGGLASATATLDPEENESTEIGAKWTPGEGHVLFTAALFRIDKTNARVNDPLTAGVQILAGKQRSQGFELGISGNITPEWAVFGGYSYIDARVLESSNPADVGGRFPNVPEHSASLLSTYELTDWLTLGGQAFYASARYGGNSVAGTATLPGYWRFDAMARVRVSSRIEARLNVLNLTDQVYYDAIYRSATPFAYVAPGRSALLSIAMRY